MNHRTAFPIQSYTCAEKGMTMRDYFAAQAMQGFCSTLGDVSPNSPPYWSVLAGDAYEMADAMMAARSAT
jgi:hypothetical protein